MRTATAQQALPQHILEAAQIVDRGYGDLHPLHQEIAYATELTVIRDVLHHFLPPRSLPGERNAGELLLAGLGTAKADYKQAVNVLVVEAARVKAELFKAPPGWFDETWAESIANERQHCRVGEWADYDPALIKFARRLPALRRVDAIFNRSPEELFPSYSNTEYRNVDTSRHFDAYSGLLRAYHATLTDRRSTTPSDPGVGACKIRLRSFQSKR